MHLDGNHPNIFPTVQTGPTMFTLAAGLQFHCVKNFTVTGFEMVDTPVSVCDRPDSTNCVSTARRGVAWFGEHQEKK